jgi:hypothetical protein
MRAHLRLGDGGDLVHHQAAGRGTFDAEIDLTYMGGIERGKRNPSLLTMLIRLQDLRARPDQGKIRLEKSDD